MTRQRLVMGALAWTGVVAMTVACGSADDDRDLDVGDYGAESLPLQLAGIGANCSWDSDCDTGLLCCANPEYPYNKKCANCCTSPARGCVPGFSMCAAPCTAPWWYSHCCSGYRPWYCERSGGSCWTTFSSCVSNCVYE